MTGTRARDRLRDRPEMYTEARSVAGTIRVGVFAAPDVSTRNRLPRRVCRRRDPQYCCGSVSTGVTVYSRRVRDSPARAGRGAGVRRARRDESGATDESTARSAPDPAVTHTDAGAGRAACLEQLFLYTVRVSVTRLMRVDPLNGFGGRSAPAAPTCGSRDVRRACAPALSVRPPHFGLYLPSAWNRK